MNLVTHALNLAYESEPEPAGLVGYVLHREEGLRPPPLRGGMFDYILTADGVYLHAKREEIEVSFPILPSAPGLIRGLMSTMPVFNFDLPLVPSDLLWDMTRIAINYGQDSKETLFWLEHSELNPYDDGWLFHEPAQKRTGASCRPEEGQDEAYQRTIIEIHSHHSMPARFSPTDDTDETGFRIYGVIGNLPEEPEIRMRVGVYGYFWEIPAWWALDLPDGLEDCNPDSAQAAGFADIRDDEFAVFQMSEKKKRLLGIVSEDEEEAEE